MEQLNPYASPLTRPQGGEAGESSGVWSDGPLLVVAQGAPLPDRCVKCNAPAGGYRLRQKMSWHTRWIYLLILVGVLFYVVAALVIQQKATIHVGLCELHQQKRSRAKWICVGIAMLAAGLFMVGIAVMSSRENEGPGALCMAFSVLLFLGAILYASIGTRVLVPKKIDKEFAWLKGADPAYLAELPDFYVQI